MLRVLMFLFGLLNLVWPAHAQFTSAVRTGGFDIITIGPQAASLSAYHLPIGATIVPLTHLPIASNADRVLLNAQMAHNPVTSRTAVGAGKQFVFLATLHLVEGPQTVRVDLGENQGGTIRLSAYFKRVGALTDSLGAADTKLAFIRVEGPEQLFGTSANLIKNQLDKLDIDLAVLSLTTAQECAHADWPEGIIGLLNGVADAAPFGDQDEATSLKEAQSFIEKSLSRAVDQNDRCAAAASLIVASGNESDRHILSHKGHQMADATAQTLFDERFELSLLMPLDTKRDDIDAFLKDCRLCPGEQMLLARLEALDNKARIAAREATLFEKIKGDKDIQRLEAFVQTCRDCGLKPDAEQLIETIEWRKTTLEKENAQFIELSDARDLDGLRGFLKQCDICADRLAAQTLIGQIEAQRAYEKERAQFIAAMQSRQIASLEAYIGGCTTCDGRLEAQTALDEEIKKRDLIAPCYAAAGLMQQGGPHRFKDMDVDLAQIRCAKAADAFPARAEFDVLLGRVAHAKQDRATAIRLYQKGMDEELGFAYGLAAFWAFAPGNHENADLKKVHAWAQKGAQKDDWLSQEILMLLYSKGLIKNKNIDDAIQIARRMGDNNPVAQFYLGYFYLTGTGLDRDVGLAKQWLEKAVAQNYAHAAIYLADILENETGDFFDPERAGQLYWLAFQDGNKVARARLVAGLDERPEVVVRFVQQQLGQLGREEVPVNVRNIEKTQAALRNLNISEEAQ